MTQSSQEFTGAKKRRSLTLVKSIKFECKYCSEIPVLTDVLEGLKNYSLKCK